jgi:EmrB/QacA subfamily drug resistance transporter
LNVSSVAAPAASGVPDAPGVPGVPAALTAYRWTVLLVAGSSVYMSTVSNGIVNVALPVLTREFGASLVLAQWVVLGYLVCVTGLLLPAGRLADILGRKEVFLVGFVLFAAGAALCGVAPALHWLIGARLLQGIGGALVQANSGALIAQAFPTGERGRALGLNGAAISLGLITGPVVGGLITAYAGWRWAFYVIVLISAVAAPAGWRLLRHTPGDRAKRFDVAGAALFFFAVASLVLGLNQGPVQGWTSPHTLALFAASLAGAALFVWVERRVASPTVDLALARNRGFAAAVCAGFLTFFAVSGSALLMPFYFQYVLRLPPDQAGFLLAAWPAASMVVAPFSGALSDRFGSRRITTLGLGILIAALGSLATMGADEHPLWAAARLAGVGIGMATFTSPNGNALFGSVPKTQLGVAGGFQALARNLGQSLGQTMGGALWSVAVLAAASGGAGMGEAGTALPAATDAPPEAMLAGFRLAFAWSAAAACLALLVSWVGRPPEDRAAH